MLFDEEDASLLKKWIVKRLEDISDADSDVLADYVLALLRHEQEAQDVKRLCIEQLVDFLKEHTVRFVEDVFAALKAKNFLSVNSTLGGGLSVTIPSPPSHETPRTSPTGSVGSQGRDDHPNSARSRKRAYFDHDAPRDDGEYVPTASARGYKAPRRGGAGGPGRWSRGGPDLPSGRGGNAFGAQSFAPPTPGFPWVPPNPNDPMAAFLAAQAAWSMFPAAAGLTTKPGEDKKVVKKVGERCKDYDEKGFCMKGDMCPYEHGVDHIVVPGQDQKQEEYDPNNSIIFPATPGSFENGTRGGQRGRGGRGGRGSSRGGRGGKSEYSHTGPSYDRSNTTLVVENIPQDKLADAAIREFFATFGNVTKVEIHPLKHLAILKFEKWEMAKQAYDSPAPIFDNRFVKVFWYKPDAESLSTEYSAPDPRTYSISRTSEKEEPEEERIDLEEVKRIQEEKQRIHDEKMAKKRAHDEAKKELEKRSQELLKLKQEETRKLMEKLSKSSGALKSPSSAGATSSNSADARSPSSDKPKEAGTTAALKAQLEALQAEAEALGINANTNEETFDHSGFRGRGRGRGAYRRARGGYTPGGRGYNPYGGYPPSRGRGGMSSMKLDNRPKRVAVTAHDLRGAKDEEFRHYLINNGFEFDAIEPHPDQEDTQIVTFTDRMNAEKFVFSGTDIPNIGMVVMKWYSAPSPAAVRKPSTEDNDTPMVAIKDDHRMDEDSYDLVDADESRWLPE